MPDDNQQSRLELAWSAIADASSENSEEVIIKIITSLEEEFGDHQKTIAEELQKIARQIEHSGKADLAMEFKQRTTSAMLRLNMERRRGLRPPALLPGAPVPASVGGSHASSSSSAVSSGGSPPSTSASSPATFHAPSAYPVSQSRSSPSSPAAQSVRSGQDGTQVEYLVHPSRDVRGDARAFLDVLKGQKVWESGGGNICAIRFAAGPPVIIVEEVAFTCSLILSVSNFEKHADDLEAQGYQIVGSVPTPSGSATVFASDCGSKFALIARK
ncbi:MAG: hypothetical protein IT342_19560 [Candidatus Melainabacteria bacterium]|nr:hypothetical protein [Candidatus Melainabacteria bacterium]